MTHDVGASIHADVLEVFDASIDDAIYEVNITTSVDSNDSATYAFRLYSQTTLCCTF